MTDEPVVEKKFNEGLDVDKYLGEGGVLATLYLEVQGNNEETAKKALEKTVFDQLRMDKKVFLLEARMFELKKDEKVEVYSGVAEVKVLARDFRWFINTVMRYGPSAIEIIEPEEVHLSCDEMHSLVADVADVTQSLSSQILILLKDEERLAFYNKMLSEKSNTPP